MIVTLITLMIVTSDGDDLPSSLLTTGGNIPTIEKLIEQARSGQLNPKASQFRHKTLMKDGVKNFSFSVNPWKFTKSKNSVTYPDYKAANTKLANQEPGAHDHPVYAHLFVSPLSVTYNDSHTPVVCYGTIEFDVLCSDLQSLGQS